MGFEEQLADGSAGVELRFPASLSRKDEGPGFVELIDEDNAVLWQAILSEFRLDLSLQHEAVKERDVERAARHIFEETWECRRSENPGTPGPDQPRGADASWSPIVEMETIEIGGSPVLRVIHRIAYQPGFECVCARLLIPVEQGTVAIVCYAQDLVTGGRESALSIALADRSPEAAPHHPGQAFFDDPAHDARFPDHVLTRVRRAQRWLLEEAGLRVLRPAAPAASGLVPLRSALCAVTPPPRYCELAPEVLGMDPSMVNFARVDLIADRPALFEVWHFADANVTPGDAEELCALAKQTVEGWANEGAQDLRVQVRIAQAPPGFMDVECAASFRAGDRAAISVQRWIADAEGRVWRLGLSGDEGELVVAEARETLARVRAGFRPMSPAPPKRRG